MDSSTARVYQMPRTNNVSKAVKVFMTIAAKIYRTTILLVLAIETFLFGLALAVGIAGMYFEIEDRAIATLEHWEIKTLAVLTIAICSITVCGTLVLCGRTLVQGFRGRTQGERSRPAHFHDNLRGWYHRVLCCVLRRAGNGSCSRADRHAPRHGCGYGACLRALNPDRAGQADVGDHDYVFRSTHRGTGVHFRSMHRPPSPECSIRSDSY